MPRVIWKGAISFGLVHIPVALYPAAQESGIDFDWLDQRSMDPVGYQRINKRTGKTIDSEHIVKGIQQEDGRYVVLSDDEIKAAYPKTTQTIEIEGFVHASEIAFWLLEKPYFLEPVGKADKVYALLREAMFQAGVIGIARLVLHTKEHLAALVPTGGALMLNTIRWASEIRSSDDLKLPPAGKAAAGLKPAELKMAGQLIQDMTVRWDPAAYTDQFVDAVQALVKKKLAAGEAEALTDMEPAPEAASSNVVDLTELLARSLSGRRGGTPPADSDEPPAGQARKPAAKGAARKRA